MKKCLCPGILAVALLSTASVRAQGPTFPSAGGSAPHMLPPPAGYGAGPLGTIPGPGPGLVPDSQGGGPTGSQHGDGTGGPDSGPPPYPPGLSPYINYLRPCGCCGPVGKDGPILYEIYTRHGVSKPFGGGFFPRVLQAGYIGEFGGRTLFFDAARESAFTIDLGLSSIWWDAGNELRIIQHDIPFTFNNQTFTVPNLRVTPSSLHQIYAHLSAGQEFYLTPLAQCCSGDISWRVGYDAGIRWGTAKVVYKEIPHGNDVVKGGFIALHTDVECPYKCCFFFAGLRTELAHIRSDILQPRNGSNLSMINFLGTLGVRF